MYDYQLKNGNIIQVKKLERKHPNLKIPEEFLLEAERLYNLGISLSEIEIILKVARGNISKYLKNKGYEIKRHNKKDLNENYFDILNCDSSYWLGFLFADGSLSSTDNYHFELTLKDYEHIEKFKKCLKSNHKISTRKNKYGIYYRITIGSKYMKSKLIEYGCVPNKTYLDWKIPNLTENNLKNFVRGYFEGDGSFNLIRTEKVKRIANISFTCFSKAPLLNLAEEIENYLPELKGKFKNKGKKK